MSSDESISSPISEYVVCGSSNLFAGFQLGKNNFDLKETDSTYYCLWTNVKLQLLIKFCESVRHTPLMVNMHHDNYGTLNTTIFLCFGKRTCDLKNNPSTVGQPVSYEVS